MDANNPAKESPNVKDSELPNFTSSTEDVIKNKQKQKLFVLGGGLLAIFLFFSFFSDKPQVKKDQVKSKKIIVSQTNSLKLEDKWMFESAAKLEAVEKELDNQRKENNILSRRMEELNQSLVILNETILEEKNFAQNNKKAKNHGDDISLPFDSAENYKNRKISEDVNVHNMQGSVRRISTFTLNLENTDEKVKDFYKSSKNYVAQGSYASGILIQAVDASVGLSSQEDPRPVLIRLSGEAISASYKRKKEKTDVSGCIITAGAMGDISSERVYIKLSKMTCSRRSGKVFEIEVKGYVSGLGKAGIRGVVVERNWDKLSKAFVSGLVSGFGSSYSQSLQPPAAITSSGVVLTQAQSLGNAMKQGAGKGIEKSGNTLSDYMMKRAEQIQPVISIPSGVEIEVVFLEGFSLEPNTVKPSNTETKTN